MGNWCSVRISFPGRYVTARIWKCDVGRTELYLLDTDHDLNLVEDRSITTTSTAATSRTASGRKSCSA